MTVERGTPRAGDSSSNRNKIKYRQSSYSPPVERQRALDGRNRFPCLPFTRTRKNREGQHVWPRGLGFLREGRGTIGTRRGEDEDYGKNSRFPSSSLWYHDANQISIKRWFVFSIHSTIASKLPRLYPTSYGIIINQTKRLTNSTTNLLNWSTKTNSQSHIFFPWVLIVYSYAILVLTFSGISITVLIPFWRNLTVVKSKQWAKQWIESVDHFHYCKWQMHGHNLIFLCNMLKTWTWSSSNFHWWSMIL